MKKCLMITSICVAILLTSCVSYNIVAPDFYNGNLEDNRNAILLSAYIPENGNRSISIDTIDIRKLYLEQFELLQDSSLIDFLVDKIVLARFYDELRSDNHSCTWFKASLYKTLPKFYYLGEMTISPIYHSFVIGVFEDSRPFYNDLIALVNETEQGFVSIAILSEVAELSELYYYQSCRFDVRKKLFYMEAQRDSWFEGEKAEDRFVKRCKIQNDGKFL